MRVNMGRNFQYLFGPVPSRRLGRSLGVDLVPFKTCTMDCVYCQLGETTCEVGERGDYVPIGDVLDELEQWRTNDGAADHITLAGSGEPTLHLRFGEVLRWVRGHTAIPSVLLTNGTLLHDPDVRAQAALADKVKVTLSAWDEASFRRLHRPAMGVTFERLVRGERMFRDAFAGELSVEVFIVDGLNSGESEVRWIAEIVESLRPDRIDLNTVVRPPADTGAKAVGEGRLRMLAELFGPNAAVSATFLGQGSRSAEATDEAIAGLVKRHPATCAQLAAEFNLPEMRMAAILERLAGAGALRPEQRGDETYYVVRG